MVKWRCKTLVFYGLICKRPCVIEADLDFEPRGCLRAAVWQIWKKVDSNRL